MRLEEIRLRNFGWYKDETINLTGVHSAVVLGMNGTGKSTAFIDAPLAALFGHCRDSSLDELLYPGADDMTISLTFQLNSQRYRVIRKRSLKTKAGKSELELQLACKDEWVSASGARIAETQQKILDLLGADYELLTSTCFFLQGKADQFTKATPSERKAILAQILRLDQYGLLKQAATRHLTIADAKHGEKSTVLATLEAEASTIASLESLHEEMARASTISEQAIIQVEAHQQELMTKKATLAAELEQLNAIPGQLMALQEKQTVLRRDQATQSVRRERAAKILENRTTIEAKVKEERGKQAEMATVAQQLEQVGLTIDQLNASKLTFTTGLNEGMNLERECSGALAEVTRRVADYGRETERLEQEIGRDTKTVDLLTKVPCTADLQARCQFTVQAVQVKEGLPDKRQLFGNRWMAILANAEHICPEAVAAYHLFEGRLKEWEAKHFEDDAVKVDNQLLVNRQDRETLRTRKSALDADLKDLAKFTNLVPELDAAEREVTSVDLDLVRITGDLFALDQEHETLQARHADRTRLGAEHARLSNEWAQDSIYLTRLRQDNQAAIGRLKELELEIKSAQDAGRQAETLRQECAQLRIDGRHFQALSTAYAQIPILIMETAIPLLEEEANRLLAKISTTGMRIRIDTQKALKSRDGLMETLEIIVRDFRGERRYELYSGAEKFKIDLVVRMGLSRLLASRAGAKLETIVIDEGFGCLDPDGLSQLRETLGRLAEDIGLLLIITHVEALKDAFPGQLLVTSDGSGSHVDVVA